MPFCETPEIVTYRRRAFPVKGLLLKEQRERRGWTQEQLAEQAGLTDRTVRNAEAGRPIHLRSIQKLCSVLHCDVAGPCPPQQLLQLPRRAASLLVVAVPVAQLPAAPLPSATRSVQVDGNFIRAQRLALALTQEQVAHRSDLSVRLVRLAESGHSISHRSLQKLTHALAHS